MRHVVTGLLFALLLIGLASCGGDSKSKIGSDYGPIPGPDPDAEVVAVSESIASPDHPVFYTFDADNSRRLIAYDWQGQRRGELKVKASEPFGVYPSADGTMILLTHGYIKDGGKAIGNVARGTWAGDNEHICSFLNQSGGPGASQHRQISANMFEGQATDASLFLETATGDTRRVLDFGSFGEHGGPAVLSCNAAADRAVLTETFVAQQAAPEVIRLSDGQVVYSVSDDPDLPRGFVASPDGSLLAEGYTAGSFGESFTVRAIPSGEVVANVTGGGIVAFSGDNSRVLTVKYLNNSNEFGEYRVIELATGHVVWSAVFSPGAVLTRPNSPDFIIANSIWEDPPEGSNTRRHFEDIWLVPETGPARMLLQHSPPIASD